MPEPFHSAEGLFGNETSNSGESFADADVNIIEGLAQYYTEVLSGNLDLHIPGLFMAYQKLLECESGPYFVHRGWAVRTSHAKEIVRIASIECRTRRVIDYDEFVA